MTKRKQNKNNTNRVLISTIIPVFNAAEYLEQTLDSVLCQKNMDNIEIICVDDCSTDNSLEILKKYAKNDNRIKVITNEINRSAGACRNIGLEMAKGEYVHFLDADDWIEENSYITMYKCIHKANADICIFLYNFIKFMPVFSYKNKN